MDGTNYGIPTSMTPIHKKKVILIPEKKSDKPRCGQVGHKQHKLNKFKDEEVTEKVAMYTAHEHKDKAGLDEDGILNVLAKDTVVEHDHNQVSYNDDYNFKNAECNKHLINDLKKVIDNLNNKWAKELIELLTKMEHKRNWLIKKKRRNFRKK